MKKSMNEIIDSILDQEIELTDQGLRPGYVLAGRKQFILLMAAMKKEDLTNSFPDIDTGIILAGNVIVPDLLSEDRLDVVPVGSIRTDSILRGKEQKKNG
ncbi:hypothetical protein KAR91_54150 [Candidatus Pacearchaeota archaeon]|nr:hypothetical protein [Candidatus Pacearchaeota archaeon]